MPPFKGKSPSKSSTFTSPKTKTMSPVFLTEARTAASLQHPNIIAIYEAGEDKGLYYFAMEFVDGKDLGTIIRERGEVKA